MYPNIIADYPRIIIKYFSGHADDVYCVSFNNDVIVSGSADSTIRIWSWYGGSLHTLKEHIGVVRCLYLYHDILITAGNYFLYYTMKVLVLL